MNHLQKSNSSQIELSIDNDSVNINKFQNLDEGKMLEGLEMSLPDINTKNHLPSLSPLPDINPNPQPS